MRPAGEVRLALLQACAALATPERGATLQEMARHACVGLDAARRTVGNMSRAGQLSIARPRRVEYRNRPVAEYVPAQAAPAPCDAGAGLARVLTTWVG
ncbi:hypothetical protein [Acidovorax sp. BLS4]|uniref:hypothetical protein n=1 Tax=Acidovorax sp. BLS4 TaxID=3273430 RepID=UPI002943057A|nr:hypothetical protein [Paracidovorax avenae]WOI43768.1 hypothetical protein R1Z03_14605 [Paracidovorax avenae]